MVDTENTSGRQTGRYWGSAAICRLKPADNMLCTAAVLLMALLVSGCGGIAPPSADSQTGPSSGVGVTESAGQSAGNVSEDGEIRSDGEGGEAAAATPDLPQTDADGADAGEDHVREFPIEVTYFTPVQTEGPYYPVSKPEDRDNDLYLLEGAEARPAGTILAFDGSLIDGGGMPVQDAVIEIWQTDNSGAYLHPADSASSRRDVNFQSYGESVTDENGRYSFRTILPAAYERRPRHIHVKVKLGGEELLTTQFYFSNDAESARDRIFAGAGEEVEALIMEVREGVDFEGNQALIGRRDIVLRSAISD